MKLHWRIATGLPVIFQEVCVRVLLSPSLGLDVPEAEGRTGATVPVATVLETAHLTAIAAAAGW